MASGLANRDDNTRTRDMVIVNVVITFTDRQAKILKSDKDNNR